MIDILSSPAPFSINHQCVHKSCSFTRSQCDKWLKTGTLTRSASRTEIRTTDLAAMEITVDQQDDNHEMQMPTDWSVQTIFSELWILSDSRSVVQYLDNWRDVSDWREMDIFNKFRTLCNSCVLHLQWIPSHVNLKYNDIADSLAKEGTAMPQAYVEHLTYLELYSRRKALVNISLRHQPAHSWYRSEGPDATIHFKGDRKDQKALARLSSGHLKTIRFSRGHKKFNICTKCNMIEATPQHLLDCVALVYVDLLKRPDFVLEVMKANDIIDLI
ncbi:hypothetical protein AVEN_11418-1 [Araneus ventricosus]|uniref:Uncharacterized protein n=1 Tax=Araneus ventricosus TaxID=182803 RepID=A0A4Y2P625_ARAVE|nr:hypothetical protein AVEN_11418-1 [Araneus ventricosus]